jgi:hypothetical protein
MHIHLEELRHHRSGFTDRRAQCDQEREASKDQKIRMQRGEEDSSKADIAS